METTFLCILDLSLGFLLSVMGGYELLNGIRKQVAVEMTAGIIMFVVGTLFFANGAVLSHHI